MLKLYLKDFMLEKVQIIFRTFPGTIKYIQAYLRLVKIEAEF